MTHEAFGIAAQQPDYFFAGEDVELYSSQLTDKDLYFIGWRMDALQGKGVSDARNGDTPMYQYSKRYMKGYKTQLATMQRHGEYPHCVLPLDGGYFAWDEKFQGDRFQAADNDLF